MSARRTLFSLAALGSCLAHATPTYHVVELGFLPGGFYSQALGLNDRNQVVGVAMVPNAAHAFIWDGTLKDIHPSGVLGTSAAGAINNDGEVAMTAGFMAFRYANGASSKLLPCNGKQLSFASGISDSGVVVGGSFTQGSPSVATVWASDTSKGLPLGNIGGTEGSSAYAVNDSGDFAGDCTTATLPNACYFSNGWRWAGGEVQRGGLNAVSRIHWAVGRLDGVEKTAIMVDLATNRQVELDLMPWSKGAQAFGINDASVVVGAADHIQGWPLGFIWTADNGMQDLNEHLDQDGTENFTITDAHAVNSRGVIAAMGNKNGLLRAVILVPDTRTVAPESMTFAMGKVVSGSTSELDVTDGRMLIAGKAFVPNLNVAPVQIVVEAASPTATPTSLGFKAVAKSLTGGSFSQSVDLYDWQAGAYTERSTVKLSVSMGENEMFATATPNQRLSRFVQTTSKILRAKVSIRATGFVAVPNWTVAIDQATWSVNL